MTRVHNFSAGPSIMPESVLEQVAAEMLDYRGSGQSVLEMSHRSQVFEEIMACTLSDLRQLLSIPDHYQVLLMQGGASTQFSCVPLNLLTPEGKADYVLTGSWSQKAFEEAQRYGNPRIAASSEADHFRTLPTEIETDPQAAYVHLTSNNTLFGTGWSQWPQTKGVPLVVDMSSDFLSRPLEIERFGLIYAGAQKNAGPAGVTVVIIREDLLGRHQAITPTMLQYQVHAKAGSLYNTPPCFAIYVMGLVLQWLLHKGGLAVMEQENHRKAALLYSFLDKSGLFRAIVAPPYRSVMNVPFVLPNQSLTDRFLQEAEAEGLVNLKGHRSVGGMRASLYNALPLNSVQVLVDLMESFEAQY